MRRPVAFMAKEELFRIPLLKQGIELYGAYPVKRGAADRSAIRSALNCLSGGWAVGLFWKEHGHPMLELLILS
jgi:1-acyl-sn-glycerol-3-phosphate acyltransferase